MGFVTYLNLRQKKAAAEKISITFILMYQILRKI